MSSSQPPEEPTRRRVGPGANAAVPTEISEETVAFSPGGANEAPDAGSGAISEGHSNPDEMATQIWELAPGVDVAVLAAAVADFRPAEGNDSKLRRRDGVPELRLEPTPDILAGVVALDRRPFVVGFAAETGSLEGAKRKATEKGVDLLVANDVSEPGSGFGTETNRVTVMRPDGASDEWPLLGKRQVADRLWDLVSQIRQT